MQGEATNLHSTIITQLIPPPPAPHPIPQVRLEHRIGSKQTQLRQQYNNLNDFQSKIMKVELEGYEMHGDEGLITRTFPDSVLQLPIYELLQCEVPDFHHNT